METIVYIGGELPDKDASALRIMSNAKALREFGYNVILIGQIRGLKVYDILEDRFEGFTSYLLPYPRTNIEWINETFSIEQYLSVIQKFRNTVAVICYNFHTLALLRLVHYGKKNGIAVLSDCTEWHTTFHLHGIKKHAKSLDIFFRMNIAQFKTMGNIVISQRLFDFYSRCNCIVIPPLVDLGEEKWKSSHANQNENCSFVYAGRIGIEKDLLNNCISALYELRDYNFKMDILGITRNEYLNIYPTFGNILDELEKKIFFHGMLPHCDAVEYIKKASFSILIRNQTRKNDFGFPTKFVESIACGTPVITSDFSDVKIYAQKYSIGIMIEGTEKKSILAGLKSALLLSVDDRKTLIDNCFRCKAFDYRTYTNELGEFVSNTVKRIQNEN